MKKITLVVGTLLLAAVLPWAAQAQEEERSFRFGIETQPLRFAFGVANLGAEFYATDKIGIKARAGSRDSTSSIGDDISEEFLEFGVSYYFGGVATSGGYVYGFFNSVSEEETSRVTLSPVSLQEVKLTGSREWTLTGGMIGHRWQSNRWYFNAGLGYGKLDAFEVKITSSDGAEEETYNAASTSVVVADFTLGIAF